MTSTVKHKNKFQLIIIEALAVIFGLLYTILYIKQVEYCFLFAIVGAILYAYLCYKKQIFAEAFLQLFYIVTGIYGWLNWGEYGQNSFEISTNLVFFGIAVLGTIGLGFLLKNKTKSKLPFLDSFTTVFSLVGTWLMVNFIHEMWLYFIAINFVSMFLYFFRGMKLSVFMYAFYVYLSLSGWFGWELFF